MTINVTVQQIRFTHARRIDRLVCAMHQDRAHVLALEAESGFPERMVAPVVVTITPRLSVWQRLYGFIRASCAGRRLI